MPTTAVLSGTITDVIGSLESKYLSRVVLVIESNTDGSMLLDTSGNRVMAGAKRVPIDTTTGAYSVTLVRTDSADVIPSGGRLYRAYLQYPSGTPGAGNVQQYSGWFELTADASLSDADKWPGLEVTAVTQALLDSISDMVDAAEAAAASVPGMWQPDTVYTAGSVKVAPDGSTISRITDGTSRPTFDATEEALWEAVIGKTGTIDQEALAATYAPLFKPSHPYLAGAAIINPDGAPVVARENFTSGLTYDPADWEDVSARARIRGVDIGAWPGVDTTGATDSSTAIAEAIAFAQALNLPRVLTEGTYKMEVTDAPGNNKDVSWIGCGRGTVIKPARDGFPALTVDGGFSNNQLQVIGHFHMDRDGKNAPVVLAKAMGQMAVFENLTGDGAPAGDTSHFIQIGETGTDPFVFVMFQNIHIKGVDTTAGAAVKFYSIPHSVRFRDFRAVNIGYPLDTNTATCTGATDLRFDGCVFEQFTSIRLLSMNISALTFSKGRIEAGGTASPWVDLSGVDATYKMRSVLFDSMYICGIPAGATVIKARNVAALKLRDGIWRPVNGLSSGTYPVGTPLDVDSTVTRVVLEDNKRDQATASGGVNVDPANTIGPISHGGILPSTDIEFSQRSFDFTPTDAQPRKLLSGRYYGTHGGAPTTLLGTVGGFTISPVYIPNDVTVDRIECEVTTVGSAGAVVRLGIYDSNSDGKPLNLILDAGTVAADGSTGVKSITISQALRPGLYWLLAVPQSQASTLRIIGFSPAPPVAGTAFSPGGNVGPNCYVGTGMTGALTTPLSTGLSAGSGATKVMIRVT